MLLLDNILHCDEQSLRAMSKLSLDCVLCVAGEVPNWVAIEILAQCISAHINLRAAGLRHGLLLGSRRYEFAVDMLPVGEPLVGEVRSKFDALSTFGMYETRLATQRDETLAQGQIKFAGIDSFETYLEQMR